MDSSLDGGTRKPGTNQASRDAARAYPVQTSCQDFIPAKMGLDGLIPKCFPIFTI